ncbi:hypothetical protein [Nubsella zeaxanthinifaciens]|uniref:hypothetical protein n=1 Tax=Nubsella zeaxanthinifaciens TaxID=392412 RepID=UPI000DE51782|nr:hypothetical protein [Nubsella zeaxanthinifaciens]
MKTIVIGSKGVENATAQHKATDKKAIRPAVPARDSITGQVIEEPKAEAPKPQAEKTEQPRETAKQNAAAQAPKVEPTKTEIKAQLKEEKAPLNLDSTIKLIETLHRRKIQRDKLLDTIGTLEAFEVAQLDDAEETDSNHFQGCILTIEDDKGKEFSTKNPFIINAVAKYVNTLCVDKLAEIEGEIIIPN